MKKPLSNAWFALWVGLLFGSAPYVCMVLSMWNPAPKREPEIPRSIAENASLAVQKESLSKAMWCLGEAVGWDSRMTERQGLQWAKMLLQQMVECKSRFPEFCLGMAAFSSCLDFRSAGMGAEVFESFIREGLVDWSDAENNSLRELPLSGFVRRLALRPQGRDAKAIMRMMRHAIAAGATAESFYAGMADQESLWQTALMTENEEFINLIKSLQK